MPLFVSPGVVLSLCALALHAAAVPSAPQAGQCRVLASNIQADQDLRGEIDKWLAKSRTLRGQCAKIAAAPLVQVWVAVMPDIEDADTRARSVVRRFASGLLTVHIELPAAQNDFVELLAHEWEHVTEFIDGIDLPALAARSRGGVTRRRPDGAFESQRAHAAGLAAAAEAQPGTDPAAAAIARGVGRAARRIARMMF
jgi:hypothetical protein